MACWCPSPWGAAAWVPSACPVQSHRAARPLPTLPPPPPASRFRCNRKHHVHLLSFPGYHENGVVKAENGASTRTKKLKSP